MKNNSVAMTLALLALLVPGCGLFGSKNEPVEVTAEPCGKQHPMEVVALALFPDPIPEARRISHWRAIIRLDSTQTCQTFVGVSEKSNGAPASLEYRTYLSSGTNQVLLDADEKYRLNGSEQCFQIVVEIDGARTPVATKQNFCARPIDKGVWSMR